MDIEKLVKSAKRGNDEAFEQLLAFMREKLYRTAYSYVRNEQDALDIYQESIYKAYTTLKTLKNPNSFPGWIMKIVVYKSIDFIRKDARKFTSGDEAFFAEIAGNQSMENIAYSLDVKEAIDTLDAKYKTIMSLRFYHDFTVKEIAKMLGCPEGTVKSYINRAKKELKPVLREGYLYE
ncbi:sigma-70 family RNA polymerase sigma factor [Lysinibacillus pakistanensis]|uniref:Sigma-70 family RNA polymerase sigma factor n=1 Tax=Lysinibacillus pakistanensis TaxID=759811 RepID=A0AAX3WUA8_9BACI|nr:sigma-70 family RNA polymerase sigma factor [Lysinibacillus pakistanensis]MDM5230741.1 sigma-70 family RNA polymerase sigma factor [Lysinibacillus pakistanensis]QGG53466.1 sigma-70 family RNA polymerase sigma factor [Lysinibacillus pakistanensis]WHY46312.1 sigma-70 family RNA polymerase sigma factor [Lysinibacillus pakistanensis]WHY51324.1 sigma-70 family RNA polymerase sigma factor [Lysinibacillus pakistanensis]